MIIWIEFLGIRIPFSATRRIPAPDNESTLLTIPVIYRRPGGDVNRHEKQPDVCPSSVQPWRRLAPEGVQDAPGRAISRWLRMGGEA
jgi:hypothetical protein